MDTEKRFTVLTQINGAPGYKPHGTNRIQALCDMNGSRITLKLWINGFLAATAADSTARIDPYGPDGAPDPDSS
ncbi:hypothetical protein [Actinoallomurus sp. CA-150999]|uniref:hypothetical protein n=1 Tax=Actinoallomurus sp. CA-150999 TaxID=3239887 RepID=UPI003D8D67E7